MLFLVMHRVHYKESLITSTSKLLFTYIEEAITYLEFNQNQRLIFNNIITNLEALFQIVVKIFILYKLNISYGDTYKFVESPEYFVCAYLFIYYSLSLF